MNRDGRIVGEARRVSRACSSGAINDVCANASTDGPTCAEGSKDERLKTAMQGVAGSKYVATVRLGQKWSCNERLCRATCVKSLKLWTF